MIKMHPHGINSILSLIFGIIFIILFFPSFFFMLCAETFNTIFIALFIIGIVMGFMFISEFFGNKLIISEDRIVVFKWYKKFCYIDLTQVTDSNIGHFCKEWWSHGDTVLSVKVFTKEQHFEFPIASYSTKQQSFLKETLVSHKKVY